MPPEVFLAGGPGLTPLATIAAVEPGQLSEVVGRVRKRLQEATPAAKLDEVLAAAALVMGLRYDKTVAALMRGVSQMAESSVYQEILGIGEARGVRETILRVGRIKFGKAGRAVVSRINGIVDVEKLKNLGDRLMLARSWDELLDAE